MRFDWRRLLLDPTGPEGGDGAPIPAETAPAPDVPGGEHPADGGQSPAWQSITDALRQHGVELPDDADDERALALAAQAIRSNRDNEYFVRLGQAALPYQETLTRLASGQGLPGSPPPAAAPDPVAAALRQAGYRPPPEYNPQWLQMVTRDGDGNIVARPGQDPTIARRVQEYAEWRAQSQDHVLGNLPSILRAAVQAQVEPLLQQTQRQVMEQVESQQAQRLIDQHRDALFQPGTNTPTPLGQAVYRHVQELQQAGVSGMQRQLDLAIRLARAEAPAAVPNGNGNGYPAGLQRQPPVGGHPAQNRLVGRQVAPAPAASQRGLSFEEMLRSNFVATGALPPQG